MLAQLQWVNVYDLLNICFFLVMQYTVLMMVIAQTGKFALNTWDLRWAILWKMCICACKFQILLMKLSQISILDDSKLSYVDCCRGTQWLQWNSSIAFPWKESGQKGRLFQNLYGLSTLCMKHLSNTCCVELMLFFSFYNILIGHSW